MKGGANMRTLTCLLALLTLAPHAAAAIYRTVDEQGNVVFTDVPPGDKSAAPVDVRPPNTFETPQAAPPAAAPSGAGASAAELDATYYTAVEIVDPGNEEAIRANDGNMVIAVAVSPPLRGDHRLVLTLDGQDVDAGATGRGVFSLSNVDRGSHTAVVKVVNSSGATVTTSAPVTFHMLRVAIGAPKPAPSPAKK
jgi:hypothetical protein